MREAVRAALISTVARFSDDALSSALETTLRTRYPAYDAWPSDAQLGLAVLGWVLGPGFCLKEFREAVNAIVPKFRRAAHTIDLPAGAPSSAITLRSIAQQCFLNADVVLRLNLNDEVLYWPAALNLCAGA